MGKMLHTPITEYSQLAQYTISLNSASKNDSINTERYNINIERTSRVFCPSIEYGLGKYQYSSTLSECKHYIMVRNVMYDEAFMFLYGVNVIRSGYFIQLINNETIDLAYYIRGDEPKWIKMGMDYALKELELLI